MSVRAELDATRQQVAGPGRESGLPISLVLGALTGLFIYASSIGPLRDIDLYWHILAGSELESGRSAGDIGSSWSFAPDPARWISTQSLSEVIFFNIHANGGLASFVTFRVVTTAAILAILAMTTLVRQGVRIGSIPFALAGIGVSALAQERPQQFTYMGAAVLGGVFVSCLDGSRVPRWWVALPLTILWANLHGGWVLAPAVLLLAWVCRLLDHGIRDSTAWRLLALGLGMLACGALSPAGFANTTAVLRFSAATGAISEWERTVPLQDVGLLTLPMLGLLCIGWARSVRVPRSEVLGAFALLIFMWTAWRNVVPGLLVLAPIVAYRLGLAFPQLAAGAEPRWSRTGGVALAGLLTILALASIPGRDPLPRTLYPVSLATKVAMLPEGQRVLNDYDVAGLILFFGGPGTQVAVDGRSDRYGSDYIGRYADLNGLKGEWQTLLEELDPTSALIRGDTGLHFYLKDVKGWDEAGEENGYVLLVPDAALAR